jgi:hypothetical protein
MFCFLLRFDDLLSKHDLSKDQLTMCRDIRKRGKNKVRTIFCFPQKQAKLRICFHVILKRTDF